MMVRAYTFNGSTFTLAGSKDDGDDYSGVWGDGDYIYCACGSGGVRAYTFGTAGTNIKINIGDAWKDVDSMKINVGDTWKDVTSVQQNIGDTWKTVF